MFTGLIQAVAAVRSTVQDEQCLRLEIEQSSMKLHKGDSIAVNGACQTVTKLTKTSFWIEAYNETTKKTNLGSLQPNDKVNIEGALKIGDSLGGHFVTGHVTCTSMAELVTLQENTYVKVTIPKGTEHLLIPEGSVALDGISLTIAKLEPTEFFCNIISHTLEHTTLSKYTIKSRINIEYDIFAKYIARTNELLRKIETKNGI